MKNQDNGKKIKTNRLIMYASVLMVAMVAFVGVYSYTGGDFSKLAGAAVAVDCTNKEDLPSISLKQVEDENGVITAVVEANDDCGLDRVEVNEVLYKLENGKKVEDTVLGNKDVINNETTFSKTYTFTKANYPLKGGQVKVEFTAVDVSGKTKSVFTEYYDI